MRFFVEYVIDEDMDSQIKKGDKQTGTLEYLTKRKHRLAEKAFLKFAWFHEAILPVSFYANTAQVQILAQIADELLFFIDQNFYDQMEQEVLNFLTNEILDLFCSYENR